MSNLLSPVFNGFVAFDSNSDAISGAMIYSYLSGTTTDAATTQDRAGTIPNTNPIIADSSGKFPPIWLDPTIRYDLMLTDASGGIIQIYSSTQGGVIGIAAGDLSYAGGVGNITVQGNAGGIQISGSNGNIIIDQAAQMVIIGGDAGNFVMSGSSGGMVIGGNLGGLTAGSVTGHVVLNNVSGIVTIEQSNFPIHTIYNDYWLNPDNDLNDTYFRVDSANPVNIYINSGAFSIGYKLHFRQVSTGQITLIPYGEGSITSSHSLTTRTQNSTCSMIHVGNSLWELFGDLGA